MGELKHEPHVECWPVHGVLCLSRTAPNMQSTGWSSALCGATFCCRGALIPCLSCSFMGFSSPASATGLKRGRPYQEGSVPKAPEDGDPEREEEEDDIVDAGAIDDPEGMWWTSCHPCESPWRLWPKPRLRVQALSRLTWRRSWSVGERKGI